MGTSSLRNVSPYISPLLAAARSIEENRKLMKFWKGEIERELEEFISEKGAVSFSDFKANEGSDFLTLWEILTAIDGKETACGRKLKVDFGKKLLTLSEGEITMKEIQTISYQSEDGRIFNRKEDCELHEDFLNKRIEAFSYSGGNLRIEFSDQEQLKGKLDDEAIYIKATGEDAISRLIDLMQEIDNFLLIQGDMAENYKKYIVLQWIENNTWIAIPDTQIEFYKNL